MSYHYETIIQNSNYRVSAVIDDYIPDLPPYSHDDAMLFVWDWRGCDGPWHEGWEGDAEHAVHLHAVLRAANAFRDVDLLTRWLNIVSSTGTTYHASEHAGNCQGDQYLYIVANPPEDFNPSESEPVCWARGDVYRLELERYDSEYGIWDDCGADTNIVYGLTGYAMTLAEEMIEEAKADDEAKAHAAAENAKREADLRAEADAFTTIAMGMAKRFSDETDPTRSAFLLDEVYYWSSKAVEARNMI